MNKSPQNGNVLFFILIAVVLFAALTYAVTSGMRGGGQTISKEQAKIAAGEIMRNMQEIRRTYKQLMEQGCSVDDIWINKTPTFNFECQIFHPDGGGLEYPQNLLKYQDNPTSQIGEYSYRGPGQWGFGTSRHVGVGTDDEDVMVRLNYVYDDICIAFNKMVGIDVVPIPTENSAEFGAISAEFIGKEAACARKTNATPNINQISFILVAF